MLSALARLFLLRRLFGGGRHRRHSRGPGLWGPPVHGRDPTAYGRRRPRSGWGMWGPVPHYTRQTRGGGRVSVGGCCLPIPLTFAAGVVALARLAVARR